MASLNPLLTLHDAFLLGEIKIENGARGVVGWHSIVASRRDSNRIWASFGETARGDSGRKKKRNQQRESGPIHPCCRFDGLPLKSDAITPALTVPGRTVVCWLS